MALIDAEDAALVTQTPWSLYARGYVGRAAKHGERVLHRLLAQPPPGADVDHWNGDKLDNRRSNLRITTRAGNNHNSVVVTARSGHRNVHWDKANQKWRVQMRSHGRVHRLGRYADLEEAIRVAEAARARLQPTSRLLTR